MKTLEVIILCVVLTFTSLPGFGQEMSAPAKELNMQYLGNEGYGGVVQTYDNRYEGVKGNPYFTPDWMAGHVELENGKSFSNIELLYNVYTDELIGRNITKKPMVIDRAMVRAFTIGKNDNANMGNFVKAAYLEYALEDVKSDRYIQELYKGEVALYAANNKKLNRADYKGAYSTGKKYDEFTPLMANYYFVTGDEEVHMLKPTKRSLLKVMKDKKEVVSNYIDEQHLDLKERDDLVELVMFYEIQHKD